MTVPTFRRMPQSLAVGPASPHRLLTSRRRAAALTAARRTTRPACPSPYQCAAIVKAAGLIATLFVVSLVL